MNTPDERILLPPRKHWTRRTHRVLGVFSMIFVVFISVSGMILNHADFLGISHRAAGPLLLTLYSDELPDVDSAYSADDVLFATASDTLYADGREWARSAGQLIGAIAAADVYVVATDSEFFVSDKDLNLIERFTADLSSAMHRMGSSGDQIVVAIDDSLYDFDARHMSLNELTEGPTAAIDWSLPATPSAEQAREVGAAALGQAINWERLLLDFHSGRILPVLGRSLADLTALCLLYMCFTGVFIIIRKR